MIEINNLSRYKVDKKLFTGIAKKVLKGENRTIETLSLAFISKEEIKKINKKYRKKNKPTDVLSFEGLDEILICPEVVREKGEDIKRVFIHGILHLLGYDHEKSDAEAEKMEKLEEKYLNALKFK